MQCMAWLSDSCSKLFELSDCNVLQLWCAPVKCLCNSQEVNAGARQRYVLGAAFFVLNIWHGLRLLQLLKALIGRCHPAARGIQKYTVSQFQGYHCGPVFSFTG